MIENQASAENAHTDYHEYLEDEQRRKAKHIYNHRQKAIDDYMVIMERMKKPKEELKQLQLQL